MPRQRKRIHGTPNINITPLVDVLLILLVIVMLVMPAFVKRLAVELPVTSFSGAPVAASTVRLTLLADDSLQVDGNAVERSVALTRARGASVEIAADKSVPYERLAKLLADLQEGGSREVSLLTY